MNRAQLISICEDAIVPMERWHNRDSAMAHEQLGRAWALLRAEAPFRVITEPTYEDDSCVTNDDTIWVEITWEGFYSFELGRGPHHDDNRERETFYLPTRKRLEEAGRGDWY